MHTRFSYAPRLLTLFSFVTLVTGCASDDDPAGITTEPDWVAALRGFFEQPHPVDTGAQGTAFFIDEGARIRYRIDVQDIQDVTLAHIHAGGPIAVGPIVVTLFDAEGEPVSLDERSVLVEGSFDTADLQPGGGITTLGALVDAMEAGAEVYVNVHTTENPDGEIRGPVLRVFPPD